MKLTKGMQLLKEVYDSKHDEFLPQFSVECVIVGFDKNRLKVLLSRMDMSDCWLLPWGLVHKDEDVDEAAIKVLEEKTALKGVYVQQFHLFGEKDRSDRNLSDKIIEAIKPLDINNHWTRRRFISVGYYALVEYDKVPIDSEDGSEIGWFDIDDLPPLFVKNDQVIRLAMRAIRNEIGYIPIGHKMLSDKFTMPELRAIYECVLQRDLDRRNFQRKVLSTGLIIPLNETRKVGAHKSPNLYCFDNEKYKELLDQDLELIRIVL